MNCDNGILANVGTRVVLVVKRRRFEDGRSHTYLSFVFGTRDMFAPFVNIVC